MCTVLLLLVMLCCHWADLDQVDTSSSEKVSIKRYAWTATNLIVAVAICIGFGKPYSVAYGALLAFLCSLATGYFAPPYYDWVERLVWVLVMLLLLSEYMYRGFRYGQRPNNN